MRPQLIMFAFSVFIIGTFYSLIASGIWFGTTQVDFINAVAGMDAVKDLSLGTAMNPATPFTWISAIGNMILWNYPYLDSAWGLILKMILLYPVSIGVIWFVFQIGLQIVGLIIQAAQALRSLLP